MLWASVYHVWLQRDSRIHGGEIKTKEQLVKSIQWDVKAKMEAKGKIDSSILSKVLCTKLGISLSVSCSQL